MTSEFLTLQEAADLLGLHYMTVYRYVRTGRLPGAKEGAEWRVKLVDVEGLVRAPDPPRVGRGRRSASYPARLEDRLVAGDATGAWAVIESALTAGMEPGEVYVDLLVPTLDSIGRGWEEGRYTVAQEHLGSAVATALIGRLGPRFNRRGRKRGSVVLGAAPGDEHALPVAIAADLLRGAGFRVHLLGDNVPADSFAETAADAEQLVGVAICATTGDNEPAIRRAIRGVRSVVDVPVILGGGAVGGADDADRLGADATASSATDLVDVLVVLASGGGLPDPGGEAD